MQAASDIMLGWIAGRRASTASSRDFYVRQLWDGKGSAVVEAMNPRAMTVYAAALRPRARQGARPLGRRDRDRRAISARATASTGRSPTFAETYADQNERDYAALQAAVPAGRLVAETGL